MGKDELYSFSKATPVIRILPSYDGELPSHLLPVSGPVQPGLQCPLEGQTTAKRRYFFNIVDLRSGEHKVWTCGPAMYRKVREELSKPKVRPKRNLFMRVLEYLGLVKPLPLEYHDEFAIEMKGSYGYPDYNIFPVSKGD